MLNNIDIEKLIAKTPTHYKFYMI